MADIKTVTAEIAELKKHTAEVAGTINIETALIDGEYRDVAEVMKKVITKLDELAAEVNTIKDALSGD
tara:strand:+ start:347 stop:550 length:204 start_codon:yes stop_codon:yes gene_type:complete